jgi:hypothetical protein
MKKRYILLVAVASLLPLNSCLKSLLSIEGNGIAATKVRRAAGFNKIENTTSINVVYKKADTTGISITADENLIDYITTETDENTLQIKTHHNGTCLVFNTRPVITITSPNLESIFVLGSGTFLADELSGNLVSIKMSGSGNISAATVTGTDLNVTLSGSGNININNDISLSSDVFLSGSGNISISGQSESAHLKISGSGKINGENWKLESADILISGSGDTYSNIEHSLTALISGSGNIYLKGDPIINKTISGSGRIIKYK